MKRLFLCASPLIFLMGISVYSEEPRPGNEIRIYAIVTEALCSDCLRVRPAHPENDGYCMCKGLTADKIAVKIGAEARGFANLGQALKMKPAREWQAISALRLSLHIEAQYHFSHVATTLHK